MNQKNDHLHRFHLTKKAITFIRNSSVFVFQLLTAGRLSDIMQTGTHPDYKAKERMVKGFKQISDLFLKTADS